MLAFACMLLLLVSGVNSIVCAPGYTCFQESASRVWVVKNDGNTWGPSCAAECGSALCGSGAYHSCDAGRTVVSGVNFNAIAAGLGFTCQPADCWDNTGTQMMWIAQGNASVRTCYFPANASGTYDCNGNPGNANCWGERFSMVCPCTPSTLEQSCPWQAPPANTAVAKWGATSTRDGSCLNRINYWRQRACAEGWPECPPCGLPPMVECVGCHECANSQADYDSTHGAHASFTRCGDMAQGEGGGGTCADVIDAFVAERAVFSDSNGQVVCRGHCGPVVAPGCQTFFWGVSLSGYYTLNWGTCNTQSCNAYCNDPAQTNAGGACRSDAWSYNASAAAVTISTSAPTVVPSFAPTRVPSSLPTRMPSSLPTSLPTFLPTRTPTSLPTRTPTSLPTSIPTAVLLTPAITPQLSSLAPSRAPTRTPTQKPTRTPTRVPSQKPTRK